MKKNQTISLILLTAMLPLSACVTDPETGNRTISKAAIGGVGGALGGYLLGDLIGGRRDRTEKIVGAGIGALAGAGVGYYMDEQEESCVRRPLAQESMSFATATILSLIYHQKSPLASIARTSMLAFVIRLIR